ncbi:catalase family peroxidase [Skermania sp. ID1734]|uniref:catalase family peroxidase n=1 Tax=Skermania sp. ID1734 TaxID=2597516 RepID=UPI00117CC7A5|nr:catalase family peroxidase [Skermania sp. ID1734]TSE01711.1 catalase family peroxidase [Skermania sp. ID1734]
MADAVTPNDAIAAIRATGGAQPGYRALHAKGTLYRGTFTATAEAASLSRAAHLSGEPVETLVRFSNGSGNPRQRDGLPHVRGMALKFSLPDGSTTDVSAQTARVFTSSTPEGFVELLNALRPSISTPIRLTKYLAGHRGLFKSVRANGAVTRIPASYATLEYHALHAFRWVDASGGARFVRYHLVPEAGEQFLALRDGLRRDADFLTDELNERLRDQPVRFQYRVQIAGPDDSTVDPSQPWQSTQTVTAGHLDITGLDTAREHGDDIVVFDPMRVTDGIEPSDDPVLRFRTRAYSESVKLRTGVERGAEAPQL